MRGERIPSSGIVYCYLLEAVVVDSEQQTPRENFCYPISSWQVEKVRILVEGMDCHSQSVNQAQPAALALGTFCDCKGCAADDVL